MWNIIRKGGPQIFTVQHSNEKYMQLRHSPFFYRVTSQTSQPAQPSQSESNALAFLFSSKRISFLFHFFLARHAQSFAFTRRTFSMYLCLPAIFSSLRHLALSMCTLFFLSFFTLAAVFVRYVLGTNNDTASNRSTLVSFVAFFFFQVVSLLRTETIQFINWRTPPKSRDENETESWIVTDKQFTIQCIYAYTYKCWCKYRDVPETRRRTPLYSQDFNRINDHCNLCAICVYCVLCIFSINISQINSFEYFSLFFLKFFNVNFPFVAYFLACFNVFLRV